MTISSNSSFGWPYPTSFPLYYLFCSSFATVSPLCWEIRSITQLPSTSCNFATFPCSIVSATWMKSSRRYTYPFAEANSETPWSEIPRFFVLDCVLFFQHSAASYSVSYVAVFGGTRLSILSWFLTIAITSSTSSRTLFLFYSFYHLTYSRTSTG